MALPTTDEMRARFHDLGKQRDQIIAKAAPIRAEFESLRKKQDEIGEQMKPVIQRMKEAESPLYAIDVERAQISRALNGKTGAPG